MTKNFGFAVLIATISLNTAGLIGLRQAASTAGQGLAILAMGYFLLTVVFFFRRASAIKLFSFRPIAQWSVAVVSIYTLFLLYPGLVSVSQLIILQSIIPLLAVIVTGDYRSKETRHESLVRLIPLGFLFALAWMKSDTVATFTGYGLFFVLGIAFLAAQSAMRDLARSGSPQDVLMRFFPLTFVLLAATVWPLADAPVFIQPEILIFGLIAAPLIFAIQAGYLAGIPATPPLLSALAISSSVPLAMFFEWIWSGRGSGPVEILLAVLYSASVVAIAARSPAPTEGKTEVSERQAA